MNETQARTLKKTAFAIIGIFAVIALFYVLDLDLIKSQSLLGLIYYAFTSILFIVLVMIISMVYQYSVAKGRPLPGFYSSMVYKNLTNEQIASLSKTNQGKVDIFYHQFIMMRMDVIFPATLIFALIFLPTIPQVSASVVNYVAIGDLLGIFVLSYVIYSQMQAKIIAIKLAGSIPEEQIIGLDEVIHMTAMEI